MAREHISRIPERVTQIFGRAGQESGRQKNVGNRLVGTEGGSYSGEKPRGEGMLSKVTNALRGPDRQQLPHIIPRSDREARAQRREELRGVVAELVEGGATQARVNEVNKEFGTRFRL